MCDVRLDPSHGSGGGERTIHGLLDAAKFIASGAPELTALVPHCIVELNELGEDLAEGVPLHGERRTRSSGGVGLQGDVRSLRRQVRAHDL